MIFFSFLVGDKLVLRLYVKKGNIFNGYLAGNINLYKMLPPSCLHAWNKQLTEEITTDEIWTRVQAVDL